MKEHSLQQDCFNLISTPFLPEISLLQSTWKYAEKAAISLGKTSNQHSYSEQNFDPSPQNCLELMFLGCFLLGIKSYLYPAGILSLFVVA